MFLLTRASQGIDKLRAIRRNFHSYLGLGVIEGQHAVVVPVLGLDVGGGSAVAELAELRHGVPVPRVHVGGRHGGRHVVVVVV